MKIEKISDNKIRVTISLRDLEERNINLDSLNYNSPAAQDLFWDMIEQAEVKFGFNISDSQLCIEALSDTNEGFVVTITRLNKNDELDPLQSYIKSKLKKSELRVKKKVKVSSSSNVIYAFHDIDELCASAIKIRQYYDGDSFLYRYINTYYLVLSKDGWIASLEPKAYNEILCEYGTKIPNATFYKGYLNEYGSKISGANALDIINELFG